MAGTKHDPGVAADDVDQAVGKRVASDPTLVDGDEPLQGRILIEWKLPTRCPASLPSFGPTDRSSTGCLMPCESLIGVSNLRGDMPNDAWHP